MQPQTVSPDLEDEERENRNCEMEDGHPDPAILMFERPVRQNRSLQYHLYG